MLKIISKSLLKVKDKEFIKGILSKELVDEYGDDKQEIKYFEPRLLKSHLRKTIIQYSVEVNKTTKTYIGIHREYDKRFEHVYSTLSLLRSTGFGEQSNLRVPRPIIYYPSLSFMLMEQAEGTLLGTIISQQATHDLNLYIEGAAKWLAKLHNSSITTASTIRIRSLEYEITAALQYKNALLRLFPMLSIKIDSILSKLIKMQKELCHYTNKNRLIHRDYHPKNIFASPHSITVIDFEESCIGDPAFDLGYFTAQMKMSYGFKSDIIKAADVFLNSYMQESSHIYDPDVEKRQRVYEAQTYFQRIYHTYWLLKLKPDIDLVSEWLRRSEICLDGVVGQTP